jgi:hypothetical protein
MYDVLILKLERKSDAVTAKTINCENFEGKNIQVVKFTYQQQSIRRICSTANC